MSFGVESFGINSFGAGAAIQNGDATAPGATLAGTSSISAGSAQGGSSSDAAAPGASLTGASSIAAGAASGGSAYDRRIAQIGDSNSSGRGTNPQPAPGGQTYLFNNSGSVVAMADPWDAGPNTYAALDDSTSAAGSFAVRTAKHFADAGQSTLWIPANKGGTQASNWAYSTSTTTCYGAMKARIDAAGGVDDIVIQLGANDAIGGVSQSLFKTRIEALIAALHADYPAARIYLNKIHHFTGYNVDPIRAAVDEVWAAGLNGVLPGADFDGISPTNVHYMTDADLLEAGNRMYAAMTASNATAAGATLNGTSSISAGTAAGQVNASAPGSNLSGASTISAGAADGQSSGSAPGASLTGNSTLTAGQAQGGSLADGNAPGATISRTSSVNAGTAQGDSHIDASAPGATLDGNGNLTPGAAFNANALEIHPGFIVRASPRHYTIARRSA